MQTVHDPSTSSYYVNEQLYEELVTSFADWQRDELAIHNVAERDQFRMLVVVCLLCAPLVFLFKRPKRAPLPGDLAAAH